jgi:thiol-disulfide isomerase/thioredoxin
VLIQRFFSRFVRIMSLSLVVSACGGSSHTHGTLTPLTVASHANWKPCEHRVPAETCTRCRPELIPRFKARKDWCGDHGVPESQCLECHPDLDFSPPKQAPTEADIVQIVKDGEALPALEPHLVAGKVTVFDFHAVWCPPCRKVDEHLYPLLASRSDVALRKIDVAAWDTPVAEQWLSEVPELPFILVYDKRGRRVAQISGAKLNEIDRAIAEASK